VVSITRLSSTDYDMNTREQKFIPLRRESEMETKLVHSRPACEHHVMSVSAVGQLQSRNRKAALWNPFKLLSVRIRSGARWCDLLMTFTSQMLHPLSWSAMCDMSFVEFHWCYCKKTNCAVLPIRLFFNLHSAPSLLEATDTKIDIIQFNSIKFVFIYVLT
jgi:hypothetical protein